MTSATRDEAVWPDHPNAAAPRWRRTVALLLAGVVPALFGSAAGSTSTDDARAAGAPLLAYTAARSSPETARDLADEVPDIYLITPGGKPAGRVTRTAAYEQSLTWSPDGTHIAYERGDPLEHGGAVVGPFLASIWVANPDGSRARPVAGQPEGFWNSGPNWSPDGKQIAFSSSSNSNSRKMGLYVAPLGPGHAHQLTSGYSWHAGPWSPDGTKIAAWNRDTLTLVDVATGKHRRLVDGVERFAAWSRDGKTITVTRDALVLHVDVGTGTIVRSDKLTTPSGTRGGFLPSPDGQTALVRGEDGLFKVSVADGSAHRLFRGPPVSFATWSPDGREVAFIATSGRSNVFYVVGADGRRLRRLQHTGFVQSVAWSP